MSEFVGREQSAFLQELNSKGSFSMSTVQMAPHVLVVEDDPDLNETIVSFLKLSGFRADGVGCASEVSAWQRGNSFDLAVVDLGLPDSDGLSVLRFLKSSGCNGIVVVTARGQLDDRLKGYGDGADHYLVKPIDLRELVIILKAMLSRRAEAQSGWHLNIVNWRLRSPNGDQIRLTRSEFAVIDLLADRPGQPCSRAEIAGVLGIKYQDFDVRRLEIMIRRLRNKIAEVTGEDGPIETVRSVGYAFAARIAKEQ